MLTWDIALSDWISWLKSLPSESIHCFVTSPPYWSLRDYQVKGQLGLEKTPEEYIARMVEGFREVRRVLRKDGTLWLNMGDSFSSGDRATYRSGNSENKGHRVQDDMPRPKTPFGLKPKDLIGMPWRVAFALQADGWYLRAQCPWIKRNSMPESVTDRPGTATETIFLLSKSQRYFYDAEAVKMPAAGTAHHRGGGVNPKATLAGIHARIGKERDPRHQECAVRNGREETVAKRIKMPGQNSRVHQDRDPQHSTARKSRQNESFSAAVISTVTTRGRRNHDWFMDSWEGLLTDDEGDPLAFIVNPAPFSEAHFATFPPALVEPCIKAGTSEKGCCAACGAPWKRILKPSERYAQALGKGYHNHSKDLAQGMQQMRGENLQNRARDEFGTHSAEYITIGWSPTCECNAGDPIPCTVADCFSGAGTTCLVSVRLGRSFKGSELNPDYREMSIRRVREDAPLFNLQTHAAVPRETEQLVLPQPALLPLPDDTAS